MLTDEELYCCIRKCSVKALPEEIVRQSILHHLINELGFPAGGIAVEKSLRQMPLQTEKHPPLRRADIICFHRDLPLLLIECKAVPLNSKSVRQVIGYNWFLKAPFIALVNQTEIRFGWYNKTQNEYQFTAHIPPYSELINEPK
jgi:sulfur carrier protein ThiS